MPETIALSREFMVDRGYAGRISRAAILRTWLHRSTTWSALALMVLAVVLALSGGWVFWVLAGFLALWFVLVPAVIVAGGWRAVRRAFPVGSTISTGFGDSRFRLVGGGGESEFEYDSFLWAQREGEFVALRGSPGAKLRLLPGSLFSDDDLARFPH